MKKSWAGPAAKASWAGPAETKESDSCVMGVMVDGNMWVQCMMGDVVHG